MISYGGVALIPQTVEQRAWVAANIDVSWLAQFAERTWPGISTTLLEFRGHFPPGPVRIGRLHWPQGASRFAVGHYLVSEAQLAVIRAAAQASGGVTALPLIINDGSRSLTTSMLMLPAAPLNRIPLGLAGGTHLLTLVDDRFRWWFKAASITVVGGSTTWDTLFASIGTALGITITVDTIHADYLTPNTDLTASYQPLPMLLDAVAHSVGHRIVRDLDGTVRSMAAATSTIRILTNASAPNLRAGGLLPLIP